VPERCPLCGGSSRRRFARYGWWIRDCHGCGHRFAEYAASPDHVARVYGDDYFTAGGAGYPGYLAHGRLLHRSGQWYARLLSRYTSPGSVLDVGCAAGFWLRGLADAGWRASGIEPNAAMAARARTDPRLAVTTGTLEQLADGGERFDLVSLIQVVAHLVDVKRSFELAAGLVRPGGLLLVETWNRESLTARVLGRHWHEYSPPSVLHWFTPASLERLGRSAGLAVLDRGRPRKRIAVAHARSLLGRSASALAPGALVARAMSLLPPDLELPHPGDDLFWMLFRKER
jgi:SAM-dependent methyltransferase